MAVKFYQVKRVGTYKNGDADYCYAERYAHFIDAKRAANGLALMQSGKIFQVVCVVGESFMCEKSIPDTYKAFGD